MTMVLVAPAEPHLICSAQNLSSSFFSTGRASLIEKDGRIAKENSVVGVGQERFTSPSGYCRQAQGTLTYLTTPLVQQVLRTFWLSVLCQLILEPLDKLNLEN